ncbi:MAG: ComF family protein [Pararhodobacter sp.]|nr:ComF family protein [Pararhodobacter sp.]
MRVIYPPACLSCAEPVAEPGALCARCWRDTPFIHGLACDKCASPLPGDGGGEAGNERLLCDDCLRIARPWSRGRAVMVYDEAARRMVLGLKYHDRHDLARPAGRWLAQRVAPLVRPDTLVAPVPLHWWRLLRRRYNQSALLAAALAREIGRPHCPDLLLRRRFTGTQDGRTRAGRMRNLEGAIAPHRRRAGLLDGRHVLLVDDVMTSGATLAACAEACFAAGADDVDVAVLARVMRFEDG